MRKAKPVLDGRIGVILPGAWLPQLDAARGSLTRCEFFREALRRRLVYLGHHVDRPASRIGQYDRAARGMVRKPKTIRRLKARARYAERRQTRKRRPKPPPPPVRFVFRDHGEVRRQRPG